MNKRMMPFGNASEIAVRSTPTMTDVMRLYLSAARVRFSSLAPKFWDIIE